MVRLRVRKKRSNLKTNLKKMEKAGEELSGVKLDKNPKIAELELRALGIMARVKKEGITSA